MFFQKEIAKLNSQTEKLEAFGREIRKFMNTQTVQDRMFEMWESFPVLYRERQRRVGYLSTLLGDPTAGDSNVSFATVEIKPGEKRKVSVKYIQRGDWSKESECDIERRLATYQQLEIVCKYDEFFINK